MPEEVVLLVDKGMFVNLKLVITHFILVGFALLVDDKESHELPVPEDLEKWHEQRRQAMDHSAATRASRKDPELATKATSEAALAKRRAREAKKAAARDGRDPSNLDQIPLHPEATTNTVLPAVAKDEIIPTSSSQFSWYRTKERTYETIRSARAAGLWFYPSDAHERSRCGVFRALWEKGNYLGCGVKFGGEYLVYPG